MTAKQNFLSKNETEDKHHNYFIAVC